MVSSFSAFHFNCIGASHTKIGTVCQDSCHSGKTHNCCYAVVGDGHGGSDYFRSDRGSAFAVSVFSKYATDNDFLDSLSDCNNDKQRAECLTQLTKSIISHWNTLIDSDIINNPFCSEEMINVSEKAKSRYESGTKNQSAYGTTLIGVVMTDSFWFGIQIGDGRCVTVSESGDFVQPIPWDDTCFLNVTTSICDENALSEFRFYFGFDIPSAIFVGSDGVDDCFAGDEKLYNFYRIVLKSFAQSDHTSFCEELYTYLPQLSEKGSGDDISIAMLINCDSIYAHKAIYEKQKKIYIHITHDGNLNGDNPNDTYFQQADIEAIPGTYSLSELNCGGFFGTSLLTFEIISVSDKQVLFHMSDQEYILTKESPVEITHKDTETSNDGPSFTAYDTLEFQIIEK